MNILVAHLIGVSFVISFDKVFIFPIIIIERKNYNLHGFVVLIKLLVCWLLVTEYNLKGIFSKLFSNAEEIFT